MKFWGLVLLLLVCTGWGLVKAFELNRRVRQLKGLLLTVEEWEREMEFSGADIRRLVGQTSARTCPLLARLRWEADDRSLWQCYRRARKESRREMCLSAEDWVTVERFFADFGKSDTQGQKSFCRGIREQLRTQTAQAEEFRRGHGKLYAAGGFLCGMLMFLLLI